MSIEQNLCEVKIFQLQSMSNAIRCIDQKVCDQEFSYFVSGLDIQLEKSEYDSPVAKKSVAVGEIQRVMYRFFPVIDTNQWLSG